jgi:hypothetical protein
MRGQLPAKRFSKVILVCLFSEGFGGAGFREVARKSRILDQNQAIDKMALSVSINQVHNWA